MNNVDLDEYNNDIQSRLIMTTILNMMTIVIMWDIIMLMLMAINFDVDDDGGGGGVGEGGVGWCMDCLGISPPTSSVQGHPELFIRLSTPIFFIAP